MLPTVFNHIGRAVGRSLFSSTQRACSTAQQQSSSHIRHINRIRLIGRVTNDMIILPNGFHSFQLTTTETSPFDGEPRQIRHKIKAIQGMTGPIIPHLDDNDIVMVDGCIAYEFITIKGQNTSQPVILANFIIPFEAAHQAEDTKALLAESLNEVKLLGQISTEYIDGNHISFYLKTSVGRNPATDLAVYNNRHKIVAKPPQLMAFVREHLRLSDLVMIRGVLFYQAVEISKKNVSRCFVQATTIHKLESAEELRRNDEKPSTTHKRRYMKWTK